MNKKIEHGNDWVYFVIGIGFGILLLFLAYIFYKRCCKTKQQQQQQQQQQQPLNFNILAPRERRSGEEIPVEAFSPKTSFETPEISVWPEISAWPEIPAWETIPEPNYENVVHLDIVFEEELNPPQIKKPDTPPLISIDSPQKSEAENDYYEDIIFLDYSLEREQSCSPTGQEKSSSPVRQEKNSLGEIENLKNQDKINYENVAVGQPESPQKSPVLSPSKLAIAIKSAQEKLTKSK